MITMTEAVNEAIEELSRLQANQQLSILKISDPILKPAEQQQHHDHRSSDASADDANAPTPASLEADLTHYKELFTKLRFSYLEQVTKEKFLRSIIEYPLPSIPPSALAALETQLAATKTVLQAQKAAVADLVAALDAQSRDLGRRYQAIQDQREQLQRIPSEIAVLKEDIAALRLAEEAELGEQGDGNPEMAQPLSHTLRLVMDREAELANLNRQVAAAGAAAENKTRELGRLEAELVTLQAQKTSMTAAAKEARRRREASVSGMGDELELQGRWYRGVDAVMRNLLEVGS